MRWDSKFITLVTGSEIREVEPLVINGFVDGITPAQLPEVPFVSVLCIMTSFSYLDIHPEKAQQLSFIDSLMLLRDVYRDNIKINTMFGAGTTSMDTHQINASLNKILYLFEEPLQPSTRLLHYA
jgi:hypothetical protein